MMDRRHFKRFLLENIDVQSKMHFSQEVQIIDVSLGGASFSINHPLIKGDTYSLKIDHDDHTFSVHGEVVWVEDSESLEIDNGDLVSVFKAGFSFKNVFTAKGDKLADLIEEKTRSDKKRNRVRGIRVKLSNSTGSLDLQDNYHVKEISFGGIQVEAGRKLQQNMEYSMKMSIPGASKPLQFIGRIASSVPIENSSPLIFKTGIEFINMGMQDLQRIQDLIYNIEKLDHHKSKDNLKTTKAST